MLILNFNEFITEKLGVAETTLFYVDPIFIRAYEIFENFIGTKEKKYDNTVSVPYSDLRPFITDFSIYAKFPVVGIDLHLELNKLTKSVFNKRYSYLVKDEKDPRIFALAGYSSGFGNKNWKGYAKKVQPIRRIADHGIILNIGISIDVHPDFNLKLQSNELREDFLSTIWHEINHSYESYNLLLNIPEGAPHKKWIKPAITYASIDANRWNFPKPIYDFWEEYFTFYMYFTEYHEMRAEIQEVAYFLQKGDDFKETTMYEYIEYMENFNSDKFYHDLIEVISKHPGYQQIEEKIANRLKMMWISYYKLNLDELDQKDRLGINSLEKMNCKEFIKFFEKIFKKRASYMKNKILKLEYYIKKKSQE